VDVPNDPFRAGTAASPADLNSAAARSCASSLPARLELLDARLELLDATIHPQKHLDHDLPARVIDRLRLSAFHA
jgi:hypothetical protein